MRNVLTIKQRLAELHEEVKAKNADFEAGRISDRNYYKKFVDRASAESEELQSELKAYNQANQMMAAGEAAMSGQSLPGSADGGIRPTSPMDLTHNQISGLLHAAEARTPFSVEIAPKKAFTFRDDVQKKTAVTESGLGGSFSGNLPPVQSLLAIGLGYEPVRIADLLPGAAMPGPSATWLSHTSNGAEVANVAEAGAKADISPVITENQVKPTKIAGQASVTLELWQDSGNYGEGAMASWLPIELTRSLINQESNILLNAVSGTSNATFNGILQTSGTLTRSMGTDSPLDCLAKSFVDLRVGAAFADPDVVLVHPATLGALRRAKDADGRYVLDLLAGPMNLTAFGQPSTAGPANEQNPYSVIPQGTPGASGNLWGATIFATTQVAAGTAVVMSVKAGAGVFWQRLGLTILFDPYTLLTNNEMRWIAEERIAYACPRPSAINLVTGLPTS